MAGHESERLAFRLYEVPTDRNQADDSEQTRTGFDSVLEELPSLLGMSSRPARVTENDYCPSEPACLIRRVSRTAVFISVTGISSSAERIDRQRVILIVHSRLNLITLLDGSQYLSGFVGMQPHFLSVLPLDERVIAFDAQHFAPDRLVAF